MNRVHRVSRSIGTPLRLVLVAMLRLYRGTLSGWLGGQCRFYPSCSHYAEDAIRARGALAGIGFTAWRVLRCNPFGRGGIDPAPRPIGGVSSSQGVRYDGVLPVVRGTEA